jgi:hypothetical protein
LVSEEIAMESWEVRISATAALFVQSVLYDMMLDQGYVVARNQQRASGATALYLAMSEVCRSVTVTCHLTVNISH